MLPVSPYRSTDKQSGFSYIEVLIATALIAIAIIPAMDALQTGITGSGIQRELTTQRLAVNTKMEEVLADSFGNVLSAAAAAVNRSTPSKYSDAVGTPDRRLVYLSYYDAGDIDGDADPFTIADANSDSDNNPYTGGDVSITLLWVRVEIENSAQTVESLTAR